MSIPLSQMYKQSEELTSVYAEEGTQAHELAEWYLRKALNFPLEGSKPEPNGNKYDVEEMEQHAQGYANYVKSLTEGKGKVAGDVEARLYLDKVIDNTSVRSLCNGTADCLLFTDEGKEMHVIDFKYGKGVEVSADNNTQLMIYALCALSSYSPKLTGSVKNITLHIYQPRISNVSSWETTRANIDAWYDVEVKQAIRGILDEQYTQEAGDHCRWCPHRPNCKIFAVSYFEPALQAMRMESASLTKEQIEQVLAVKDELVKWLNELSDKVLSDILAGDTYEGYKVVEGRSNRVIVDKEGAIAYLRAEGYKEQDIFKPLELQTLTNLQKLVGKKKFDTEMAPYIEKPQGRATLATADDKRPDFVMKQEAQDLTLFQE